MLAIGYKLGCTASTLLLDLQGFTSESVTVAKTISTNRDQTRAILLTLERLRSVLSTLLTPGLNEDIDGICSTRLGVKLAPKPVGFARYVKISFEDDLSSSVSKLWFCCAIQQQSPCRSLVYLR
jgi:hypothetical protein